MFSKFFGGKGKSLAVRCKTYLEAGPPQHMTDYVPESLTEIVIAHGAQNKKLDPELMEIAGIIGMESEDLHKTEDPEIREYMVLGAKLVQEVLNSQ